MISYVFPMRLQRSSTVELLLLEAQSAPATLLNAANTASGANDTPATLLDATMVAFGPSGAPATPQHGTVATYIATERSGKAPGRCRCCFWGQ